jgi:hypothetical protein
MDKINLSKIFKDHFKTLRSYDKGRISVLDIILFYIFPLITGILASTYIGISFFISVSTELITFYSVFGGFMLNLLVLIYGFDTTKFKSESLAKEVLDETTSNISYLVAVASLLVILLFILKAISGIDLVFDVNDTYAFVFVWSEKISVSFFVFAFLNFCLTILMVLKRFYSLDSNRK